MLTLASRIDVMNRLGRAMADPTRSQILLQLLDGPGYPAELARTLALTRSNVSNHLSCLRGCGIIAALPEGRRMRYEIADGHITRALTALLDVVLAVDDGTLCDHEDSAMHHTALHDTALLDTPLHEPAEPTADSFCCGTGA